VRSNGHAVSSGASSWAVGYKAWTTIVVAFVSRVVDASRSTAFVVVVAVATQNALYTASLAILSIVPIIVLGPWAGMLIDRYRPSTMISLSLGAQAVIAAGLCCCWAGGYRAVWVLLFAAFLLGAARAFTDNSLNVLIPHVTPSDKIHRANGLMSTGQSVSSIIGPAIGSALALLSPVGLFWGWAVASGAVGLLAVLVLRSLPSGEAPGVTPRTRLRDGFVWIWHDAPVRGLLTVVTASNVAYGLLSAVIALFALNTIGLDAHLFGLLTSALSLAGLLGSALVTAVGSAHLRTMLWVSRAVMAISLMLLAASWSVGSLFVFYSLLGLSSGMWNVVSSTALMQAIPKDVMGRVMATYRSIAFLGSPVGSGIGGPLGGIHLRLPLAVASGIAVLSLLIFARTPTPGVSPTPDIDRGYE